MKEIVTATWCAQHSVTGYHSHFSNQTSTVNQRVNEIVNGSDCVFVMATAIHSMTQIVFAIVIVILSARHSVTGYHSHSMTLIVFAIAIVILSACHYVTGYHSYFSSLTMYMFAIY